MEVIIQKDGKSATDLETGKSYVIHGLEIIKKDTRAFYANTDPFFRAACPSNTKHGATVLPNGKINLY